MLRRPNSSGYFETDPKLGRAVVVGLGIPHFGFGLELGEQGIDLGSEEAAPFRKRLAQESEIYYMAPIEGCRVEEERILFAVDAEVKFRESRFAPAPAEEEQKAIEQLTQLKNGKRKLRPGACRVVPPRFLAFRDSLRFRREALAR